MRAAAAEVRAVWGRPFGLAILALLVALGVVLLAALTGSERSEEVARLRRQVDEQQTQIARLSEDVGANQLVNDCRARAAALESRANGAAEAAFRQAFIDRLVAGQPLPERSGQFLVLNEAAKRSTDQRVAAAAACTVDPNFIPPIPPS